MREHGLNHSTQQTTMPNPQLPDRFAPAMAFGRLLVASFVKHGNLQRASALAYTTLLSLVPLMAVVFAIFSAFPIADQLAQKVQDFVFQNFMPAAGEAVQAYLAKFSAKAGRMSGVSFIALLVVALLLMGSIESAFNDIWEVKRKRRLLGRFLVYWAALSLGPVLIAISILASSYIVSLPLLNQASVSQVGKEISNLVPMASSVLAFALFYWLVPNKSVRGWHALSGGLLAAILFEWAKSGFAWYVTSFTSYQAIYGALAAVPIFLVWIYVSWLVVLLGAEFVHVLGIFGHEAHWRSDAGMLESSLRVLQHLAEGQKTGQTFSLEELVRSLPGAEAHLNKLQQANLVVQTDQGEWLLSRRLDQVSLYQLYLETGCRLPKPDEQAWPQDESLAKLYHQAHQSLSKALGIKLDRLA